jgi:hypothetical protein
LISLRPPTERGGEQKMLYIYTRSQEAVSLHPTKR